MTGRTLAFDGGTLVLYGMDSDAKVAPPFRWIKGHWRCEAYHYAVLREWLRAQGIRDSVPRWGRPSWNLQDAHVPHDYQNEALDAWEGAARRGSIVLPTGSGKTFVAVHAIHRARCAALVVAPTIDLLHQWYARLVNAFQVEVGVYYGAEKNVQPLTVTTYHSAGDLVAAQGNAFKLIIFDEVHHLPSPQWGETALMAPAPYRLGLTATYPEPDEQADGRWRVDDLIGPLVYVRRIDDLAEKYLAAYRTERLRIDLRPEERQCYEADYAIYSGYFRASQLARTHGKDWLKELMRRSAFDPAARRAFLARQRLLRLLASAAGKFEALERLLREYSTEQVLIFADNTDAVYAIARRHLVPPITAQTKAAERKAILDRFRGGEYRAVVTAEVLNEGVDVPEAKIAIVLGGTSGAREYVQRLGRVLRKVANRKAALVEVVARGTLEESKAQRRKQASDRRAGD